MLDWLHNLKRNHIDNATDYQKGRRTGIAIGIGLFFALHAISIYRTRRTHFYPELRQAMIKMHGHDFGLFKEPMVMEVCQVESEIKNQLARDRRLRGLTTAFEHGKWNSAAAAAAAQAHAEEDLAIAGIGGKEVHVEAKNEMAKAKERAKAKAGIVPAHLRDPFLLLPPFTVSH